MRKTKYMFSAVCSAAWLCIVRQSATPVIPNTIYVHVLRTIISRHNVKCRSNVVFQSHYSTFTETFLSWENEFSLKTLPCKTQIRWRHICSI